MVKDKEIVRWMSFHCQDSWPLTLVYPDMYICLLSLLWSYGSCIYNYLCNQCLSPRMLWIRFNKHFSLSLWIAYRVRAMVFNITFNYISAISLWSVLLVEETRLPRENQWHIIEKLNHIMLHRVHLTIKCLLNKNNVTFVCVTNMY
jgi:hypothetical protein